MKYDWNELFKYAKEMNEQNTIELEKWDYFKTPYSPLTGISETLYRLYSWASVNGQEHYFTKNDRKVIQIIRKAYEEKYQPFDGRPATGLSCGGPPPCIIRTFPPGPRTAGALTSC